MSRPRALSDACRAELCLGLARALSAGLDAERAARALDDVCGGTLRAPLARVANAVRKGTALALALERQGLLSDLDYSLVSAGETAGRSDRVLERLAARYERAHARWRKLKGRLMMPVAVLVIGILVLPLPALAAGTLGVGEFVVRTASSLLALTVAAKLASATVRHWRAHGTPGALTRIARALPLLGRMSRAHERADVCEMLALALASGMPAAEALADLARAERNPVRAGSLLRARTALDSGGGVAGALAEAGLLDAREGYALVSTGEAAGRLDDALSRYARARHGDLDDLYDVLAQWLPVVVYVGVAGIVAAGLIG